MKKMLIIFVIVLLPIICFNNKKIYYVEYLPFNFKGMTIPPIGIFINEKYKNEKDKSGSLLRHETIHWLQYEKLGVFNFYKTYFIEYYRHGYKNNKLEIQARKLSKKQNPIILHK
jgi:hypothetical protein